MATARRSSRIGEVALVYLVIVVGALFVPTTARAAAECKPDSESDGTYFGAGVRCAESAKLGKSDAPSKPSDVYTNVYNLCEVGPQVCGVRACPAGQLPYMEVQSTGTGPAERASGRTYCAAPGSGDVAGRVLVEFRKYRPEVAAPTIEPGGWALTNYPSVFSSSVVQRDVPLALLGQSLVLRVSPTNYRWNFGDGESLDTTKPGNRYDPVKINRIEEIEKFCDVTHRYRSVGWVRGRLTVTFGATYSFHGGPFESIPGTISASSPEFAFTVSQARGELIVGK